MTLDTYETWLETTCLPITWTPLQAYYCRVMRLDETDTDTLLTWSYDPHDEVMSCGNTFINFKTGHWHTDSLAEGKLLEPVFKVCMLSNNHMNLNARRFTRREINSFLCGKIQNLSQHLLVKDERLILQGPYDAEYMELAHIFFPDNAMVPYLNQGVCRHFNYLAATCQPVFSSVEDLFI